jgi:tetratricopeptide (TPR) repeat protein
VTGGRQISAVGLGVAALLAVLLSCGGGDPLKEVRTLQAAGRFQETLEELRSILAEDPDQPEASLRLGLALINLGRPNQALAPLRNAAASDAYAVQAGLVLATALSRTQNLEEAQTVLERVLQKEPENRQALVLHAQAALEMRRGDVALESVDRLLQIDPGSRRWRILRARALAGEGRLDEAEALYAKLLEAPGEEDQRFPERVCLQLARFRHEDRGDPDRAAETLVDCVNRFPESALVAVGAAQLYDGMERQSAVLEVLRSAIERIPDALLLRLDLAQRLVARDQFDEAEAILAEQTQLRDDAQSWSSVAGVRRQAGELESALEAVETALSRSEEPSDELLFFRSDLLVDLGRFEEAAAAASQLSTPLYVQVIEGRLAQARGESRRALELYSAALRSWPDNYRLRVHTALAAMVAGDMERAEADLLVASRQAPRETDAALWLARLHFARGEYEKAAAFALNHVKERGATGPAGHLLAANAYHAMQRHRDAMNTLAELGQRRNGAFAAVALSEVARLTARSGRPDAAIQNLEAGIRERELDLADPGNQAALRQLVKLMVDLERLGEALARVEGLVAKSPESPDLLAIRGRLLLASGRPEEAEESFSRALELEPQHALAMAGRSLRLRQQGNLDVAIEWMERAAAREPDTPEYAYVVARMIMDRGDREEGRRRLEALVRLQPVFAPAANDLAWELAVTGTSLEYAERLAQRALRLAPRPEVLDTLGFVKLQRGSVDQAIRAFGEVLEKRPEYATARYHLALALVEKGDREAASRAFRLALESPFPEAPEARLALERLDAGEQAE